MVLPGKKGAVQKTYQLPAQEKQNPVQPWLNEQSWPSHSHNKFSLVVGVASEKARPAWSKHSIDQIFTLIYRKVQKTTPSDLVIHCLRRLKKLKASPKNVLAAAM